MRAMGNRAVRIIGAGTLAADACAARRAVAAGAAASVLLALAACASMDDMRSQLETRPSCCASFKELPTKPAGLDSPIAFSARDEAPVFAFKGGKSHFIAIRLPQPRTANLARIEIDTSGFVGLDVYKNTVRSFCPAYTLLDEDFVELKSAPVQVVHLGPTWLRSAHFEGRVRVPAEASYLIVHTSRQLLESSLNLGPSGGYIGPYSFLPDAYSSMRSEGYGEQHCAPEANVAITLSRASD